jgi:hypothetical protein
MRSLRRPLILLLRVFLGALLLYAAASKWRAPHDFAEEVANYRILPAALVPLFSAATLGVETVLGLLLLSVFSASLALEAALATAGLLLVFTGAVASALVRDLKIECGCFGLGSSPATTWTLLRDLVFLAAAAALFMLSWRKRRPG